jgi:retron-type reverse transcriptase
MTGKSNSVTIIRNGQHTFVWPSVKVLEHMFHATTHMAVDDAGHGVKIVRQPFPLAWTDELYGDEITVAYAGLESRFKAILEAAGYEVRLMGARPRPLPRPQKPKSGGFDPDDALLKFVRDQDRGLIRYDPAQVRVERLIAQVAEAYPKFRILVVASRQNDVLYLHRQIRLRELPAGRAYYNRETPSTHRIAVVTYSCVGKGLADAANRDIVFYVNPSEAFGKWGRLSLAAIGPARLFGFMAEGFKPRCPVNDLIDAVFGPESVYVPRHGRIARPVEVFFVASPLSGKFVQGVRDLDLRRRLIWHNPARNRRIAQVADACRSGDHDKLDRLSQGLGNVARRREDGYVAVLVENVEHGLELRRHLPGWPVVTDGQVTTTGFSRSDRARIESVESGNGLPHSAIITMSAMPQATHFDTIIRADAGLDLPALGGSHLLSDYDADNELLLIDLDDRRHPAVGKWTRSRKAAYTVSGWDVAGGPQVRARDRIRTPGRRGEPVLPYQTPWKRRPLEGDYRTPGHNYEKRRRQRRNKLREEDGGQITLRQIADPEHLVDGFRMLVREGGHAAGIDGISPQDISMSDIGGIAQNLSTALLEKRWRPQKTRPQPIPKPGTDEKRILKIGVALDRGVGKSLHVSLQPAWEKLYLRNSFGFRPGRSVWQMAAEVIATMEKYDRWVLVTADVRKAFDNVRIKEAIQAHQTAMQNKSTGKQPILAHDTLELIETVLRGHDEAHEVGIDQGGCYSPDALNMFLHVVHDIPLDAMNDALLWFRYADNLVYAVQSVSEGYRVLAGVQSLLRKAGLSLKGDEKIVDLNTAQDNLAYVLGFSLWREDGRLRIGPGKDYLTRLGEHLVTAWETSDPNMTAKTVLRGWIDAKGPAFNDGVAVIADVLHLSARLGFGELPGPDVLWGWWEESWERWQRCYRLARRRVLRRVRH